MREKKSQDNSLSIQKVSILEKISSYFKALFHKKPKIEPQKELTEIEKSKNNFWKNIKLEEKLEDQELLELQRKVATKEINIEDLEIEEIKRLTELYKRQTERIVRKIEEVEAEAEIINMKISRLKGENIE